VEAALHRGCSWRSYSLPVTCYMMGGGTLEEKYTLPLQVVPAFILSSCTASPAHLPCTPGEALPEQVGGSGEMEREAHHCRAQVGGAECLLHLRLPGRYLDGTAPWAAGGNRAA